MPESATLPAASSERLSRPIAQSVGLTRRVDALLVALVLAFAFVVGSFVARNSDVWLHLATGRLIVAGEYSFGADPFAFTTTDQYWANHSWLFDALFYLAVTQFGGGATVVVKSLVVALTAGAMLFAARGRGSVWVPAIVVMLAVLAMSPRVLLQPSVVSFLLLAVCLCALRTGRRALIAVPVLIAVWVNLDAWFLLGPALVGLFWLGRRIDPERGELPAWPAWFMPASCAACLVSPHHIFALRFPAELSPRVWSGFAEDPRLAGVFVSPWHLGPLSASGGYNLAAWAFIVLFVLGVLSFGVNRRALRSWRFTVWLPFALLAAWQARLIPFFAVVAGPIVALNLREVVSSMAFTRPGRAFALTVGITLLALAWFGRLNGFHNRDRGAAWAIHTDPSLANAAKGVAAWRAEQGVPPEARILALHPDMGHYLAWFAPGERTFIDSRWQLFTGVADDWKTLSRAVGLLPNGTPADTLFRKHNIVAVLLSDPDGGRLTRAMRDATSRWDVARIDGASVLLVPKLSKGERFDPEATAFGGGGIGVPANGSPNLAEPIPWWEFRRTTGRGGSWEADAATVYLRLFEDAATKSPAFPILAVRASRVGIEADSTDPTAWFILGRAYSQFGERTWERELGNGFTPLEHVRLVQLAGALVQAVLRNPDSVPAHEGLTAVMLRRNSLDLALRHATEGLRLTRRSGALPGETVEAFGDRIARAAALVESLEASVLDSENRYLIRTTGLSGDPLDRARIATELGLSQRAIDVLLK